MSQYCPPHSIKKILMRKSEKYKERKAIETTQSDKFRSTHGCMRTINTTKDQEHSTKKSQTKGRIWTLPETKWSTLLSNSKIKVKDPTQLWSLILWVVILIHTPHILRQTVSLPSEMYLPRYPRRDLPNLLGRGGRESLLHSCRLLLHLSHCSW